MMIHELMYERKEAWLTVSEVILTALWNNSSEAERRREPPATPPSDFSEVTLRAELKSPDALAMPLQSLQEEQGRISRAKASSSCCGQTGGLASGGHRSVSGAGGKKRRKGERMLDFVKYRSEGTADMGRSQGGANPSVEYVYMPEKGRIPYT